MTELSSEVVRAAGGLDRWRQVRKLTVRARVRGELWGRRGQAGVFEHAVLEIDPHTQRVAFLGYPTAGRRGLFEPTRVSILDDRGHALDRRDDPASALEGQTKTSRWDDLTVIYTAGFDLWHFFVGAFVLTMPGVVVDELEPWEEVGERWRRLRAAFPKHMVAHAHEQVYAFDHGGHLRRFEYSPHFGGVPSNVNYAADHREHAGLSFAMRRRMLPLDPDGYPRRAPVLMSIDVDAITVE